MNKEEFPFLHSILIDPADESCRQVYAEWLEERGDPRADYVRLAAPFDRISFVDWCAESIDYYIEHFPELQEAVNERRSIQALREQMRQTNAHFDPGWVAFMNTLACPFRPFHFFNNSAPSGIHPSLLPFTETIGTRGAIITFESSWKDVTCTAGLFEDLRILTALELDDCAFGAASCPIHPFLCSVASRDTALTAKDVIDALKLSEFSSRHIETLDATRIPYPGYNPGDGSVIENDEIHNDFGAQYMFPKRAEDIDAGLEPSEFSEEYGTHGVLKKSVSGNQLWYVLKHIQPQPYEEFLFSEYVVLFAVGLSRNGDRLLGAVTHQVCHNLCD